MDGPGRPPPGASEEEELGAVQRPWGSQAPPPPGSAASLSLQMRPVQPSGQSQPSRPGRQAAPWPQSSQVKLQSGPKESSRQTRGGWRGASGPAWLECTGHEGVLCPRKDPWARREEGAGCWGPGQPRLRPGRPVQTELVAERLGSCQQGRCRGPSSRPKPKGGPRGPKPGRPRCLSPNFSASVCSPRASAASTASSAPAESSWKVGGSSSRSTVTWGSGPSRSSSSVSRAGQHTKTP